MSASDEQAAGIARLLAADSELAQAVAVRVHGSVLSFHPKRASGGDVLELRPPPGAGEVPVFVELGHGPVDLQGLGFDPAEVALVQWDGDHLRRGLMFAYPQMLDDTAIAGTDHRVPVAGGRRGDGLLELWIESSPTGRVRATIDAARPLGCVADLTWRTPTGAGRLLVALVDHPPDRGLGACTLAIDARSGLSAVALVVRESLADADPDHELVASSRAAGDTPAGRERWTQLVAPRDQAAATDGAA